MRTLTILSVAAMIFAGCAKQGQQPGDKAGAAEAAKMELIGSDRGFIIENARFTAEGESGKYKIGSGFSLIDGQTSVLIITEKEQEGKPGYVLALQFPVFAEGTSKDYSDDAEACRFWVMELVDGSSKMSAGGRITGGLRFIKKSPSAINLGLNREILDGEGDIEVTVGGIESSHPSLKGDKSFDARFRLPMVTLEEMARVQQPA